MGLTPYSLYSIRVIRTAEDVVSGDQDIRSGIGTDFSRLLINTAVYLYVNIYTFIC